MRDRILDINPKADVRIHNCFYLPENAADFDFSEYDYVVDAVDTVTAKIELIMRAKEAGTPVISSMGAGNKLDASAFRVADIYKTKVCPLAKVMRRELKKRGVKKLRLFIQRNSRSDQLKIWQSAAGRIVFVLRVPRISVRSAEIFRVVWRLCRLSPG